MAHIIVTYGVDFYFCLQTSELVAVGCRYSCNSDGSRREALGEVPLPGC